ncbi:hypothetical protein HZS_2899 [Henneguya salminicola]|nr:hypothetical protein HZS_2899 [Henneguya salminicola]
MDDDTEVNEDQQDVENRLRSFVKVPEDVPFECFVKAAKDLFITAKVSEGENFKPYNKNEEKELYDQNL